MAQDVAAEVAKAQLLHSKGGASSKNTICVSWIACATNPHTAFMIIYVFVHHISLQVKTTTNLVFLFISFLLLSIQTVWFHKMYFTWGSPACTLLPILSKSKESIKDLNEDIHLNSSMLSSKIGSGLKTEQTNKQMNEQTSKQTNTWTPMRNHEHP